MTGEMFYYTETGVGDSIAIFSLDISSKTERRILTLPSGFTAPGISPDKKWIASLDIRSLHTQLSGNSYLVRFNIDGTSYERLSGEKDSVQSFAWSPSSAQIAFVNIHDTEGLEIYDIDLEGNVSTRLTNDGHNLAKQCLSWSPNGNNIAYSAVDTSSGFRAPIYIFVINLVDRSTHKLTSDLHATHICPAWSPDGGRIAFDARNDTLSTIYAMDANGANLQSLTSTQVSAENPIWSPDGHRIAFISDRDGYDNIYTINADGTDLSQITHHRFNVGLMSWHGSGK